MNYREQDELIAFAHALADRSRQILLERAALPISMELKSDASPVTELDRNIETILREQIQKTYPAHGILGEELGADRTGAEIVWVLDPIDGTAHFIAGVPLFGTLIAVTRGGHPWIGLIDIPATGDRWLGVASKAAWRNGKKVRTRSCENLKSAFMSCSNPDMFSPSETERLAKIKSRVGYTLYGASSYAFGALASGRTDLALDAGLGTYDVLAPSAIISGAGGRMTDWTGTALTIESAGQTLAIGDLARMEEILELLHMS